MYDKHMESTNLETNIFHKPPIVPFVEKLPVKPLPDVRKAIIDYKTGYTKADGY